MKARLILPAVVLTAALLAEARQPGALGAFGATRVDVQELKLPKGERAAWSVPISLDGRVYELDLVPHSVRGPHFRLLVQNRDGVLAEVPAGEETTYRGAVRGQGGSIVAASLTDRGLTALVRLSEGGGAWSVQPLADVVPGAPATSHAVVSERDWIRGMWRCGVADGPSPHHAAPGRGGTDAFLACQLAIDADHEFYLLNGSSVPNTSSDISAVVNAMGAIYQADTNVTFQLGTVIVRQSSSQPYTVTDASALLTQFRNEWNANQAATVRDIAHLFTGKDLDGSTVGLAYVGVVCNSTFGYGLSQSRYTASFGNRVAVTSHEAGHNFNEGHCNSSCSPCRIMCSGIGGCTGVVNSFGCSAAGIASYAAGSSCLTPANDGLGLPFSEVFSSTVLDYNWWPAPSNSGGVVTSAAVSERSAPYSLNLSNTASISSAGIDLTSLGGRRVFVRFWSQHLNVESGKVLAVAYRRPVQGDYLPLTTITSNGSNQTQFSPSEVVLPTDGHGANAILRFSAQGNQADDAWYIDDVTVSMYCRADLNEDWALNIFDFQAYQAGLATLNTSICDWNGDGFITVLDFSAFLNAVTAGCTGY